MNQREPTSAPPRGVGQALPCLALILLAPLAVDRAWSRPAIEHERMLPPSPSGYLPAIGAPSMRFLAPTPPPDLVTRPPAAAPPQPAASDRPDVVPPAVAAAPTAAEPVSGSEAPPIDGRESSSPSRPTPMPILVDELRPRVRAEDFLPYFQIPAEGADGTQVIVPVMRGTVPPAPLPTSSATYTQSPR